MISEKKFDFWYDNNINVLITGEHGVGKTAIVEQTFERKGLKIFDIDDYQEGQLYYLYFSAGTMDPFVDMIGVPREKEGERKGTKFTFLDLLRPLPFALDCIGAIFIDEINRADAKVRNAVMEIIHSRSINGKKFHNLKMIWAARNPEDDAKTYDVERLDPAQIDRFPVHTSIDFKPDKKYFYAKYGEKRGGGAIEWWEGLPKEHRHLCSPRRLEYALKYSAIPGCDLKDFIHHKLNVTKLIGMLQNGLARQRLVELLDANNEAEAETFLADGNNFAEIETWLYDSPESAKYRPAIFRCLHSERLAKVITFKKDNDKYLAPIFSQYYTSHKIGETVTTILKTTKDSNLTSTIIANLPQLPAPNAGNDPTEFKPTAVSNKAFSTVVTKHDKDNAWKVGAGGPNVALIADLQDVPFDISTEDCTHVKNIACGIIKHFPPDLLKTNIDKVLGPLNWCLARLKENITTNSFYKLEVNKLVMLGVEAKLWTGKKV